MGARWLFVSDEMFQTASLTIAMWLDQSKAAVVKLIDYGLHHPDSSQGGGIKNKSKNK